MKIYPAIDLRAGRVVQLVGGDPGNVAVSESRTPDEQARYWREKGAKRLHVIDLDAALGGANQWHLVEKIARQGLPVQFGGGVRHMKEVQQLLDLGVQRVIVGTQAIAEPRWLTELCILFPGRMVLAVDGKGRDIHVKGWQESSGKDLISTVQDLPDGLAGILYTNVTHEGRMTGLDADIMQDLRAATETEVIASGGVKDIHDLDLLSDWGYDGVVLGMSIYTGNIDLEAAVKRHEAEVTA